MLSARKIGVVILARNGETRLRYDSSLEIKPGGKWEVHHEPNADSHEGHADLRDLSC